MNQEDMRKEFEVWQEIGQFNGTSAAILWAVWQAATQAQHDKHQAEIAMLRDFISKAQVSSGICCCGDSMERNSFDAGHSPVDMWDNAVGAILSTPPTKWLDNKLADAVQSYLQTQAHRDYSDFGNAQFADMLPEYFARLGAEFVQAIRNKEKAE